MEFEGVVAYFPTSTALRAAIRHVRGAGVWDIAAYLPLGDGQVLNALDSRGSAVRWITLAGGLTGIATALAMTIGMSWSFPIIVGGKPITAWPPFIVISFELMVLFGGIATVVGFLRLTRLPDLTPSGAYHPSLVVDRFALLVPCRPDGVDCPTIEHVLREAGAVEVRIVPRENRSPLQEVS
ncbi:MAG: DUF3341 domain-containing protein [Armatimonadetes bacterium]|nr:DUF3341 domain-containing protein [Armatimonadota bacterium]